MYSNKENVNILTALLIAHGIKHAVVCPGSRNAPIVHNLNQCKEISCFSVTDERSAGFYALGIAQKTGKPVVVCVTSGTALLNVLPAVAEAYYQHIQLIVVSADRPLSWINQQDGQTLPQTTVLHQFVCKAVSLPEPANDEERWHCNRLVNEALLASKRFDGRPVHINIPLSEPLFEFNCDTLPLQRIIHSIEATAYSSEDNWFYSDFTSASRPMIVVGQLSKSEANRIEPLLKQLQPWVTVIYECLSMAQLSEPNNSCLSSPPLAPLHIDKALLSIETNAESYKPDVIFYVGGELISKKLKRFLRQCHEAKTWIANQRGEVYDTFMNLTGIIQSDAYTILKLLTGLSNNKKQLGAMPFFTAFHHRWQQITLQMHDKFMDLKLPYSQLLAVRMLFNRLESQTNHIIHAANSTPVRLVNLCARQHVFCNRGVNGIEGSLSAAAGYSLVSPKTVYCIIGDLSFFYDQNALFPPLKSNFRIILLNNGGGGIFQSLLGLEQSEAYNTYISAQHNTSARGICKQSNIDYLSATNEKELQHALNCMVNEPHNQPVLLEIFTKTTADNQAMNIYYQN